ncbi:MAG: phosphate ABC transporter substrate-binding protein PstS [bacterium]
MKKSIVSALVTACLLIAILVAPGQAAQRELIGAGATFPYPLYSKMFDVYSQQKGVKINYQAIGSGGGIKQLMEKTVDFGGTDAFLTDEEIKSAGSAIVHVPTCLGAVVLTYDLPGDPTLRFTPDIVADIFLGKLTQWNDQRLKDINPEVSLPDMTIVVVHRSDGSGTTFIFSDYLGKVSAEWKEKVGVGKSLNWPAGLGAKGNPGVAGLVKQIPGSIGYVELIYAAQNKMPVGSIRNAAGEFVEPSTGSVSLAAVTDIPADTRVSITDTPAKGGYPIGGFTWLILYADQKYGTRSFQKAEDVVNLVWWAVHEGQQFAPALDYSPLPKEAVTKAEAILRSVTYGGKPVLKK